MEEQIELMTVLKELHHISGFRISIYDNEMKEICAYPKELTYFCKLIQQNKLGLMCCHEYDSKAFDKVKETETAYIYRCKFGLYEAVSPLYHFGVLSGYLMMGQTLDTLNHSISYTYETASSYFCDKDLLDKAIKSIPISTKDKISSCITIMKVCASYITLSNRLKQSDKDLTTQVKKYINCNYSQKINLKTLCDEFYCSKSTLTNTFKKTYHTSVNDYITKVRLDKAKSLLTNKNYTIHKISKLCGFGDQNYFSKVFFKHNQMTPTEYKNLHKNKDS